MYLCIQLYLKKTILDYILIHFGIIYHSNIFLIPFVSSADTHFVENAWLWVDFFFILRGYIIAYICSNFSYTVTHSVYKKYIAARFAGIYPLHFSVWFGLPNLFLMENQRLTLFQILDFWDALQAFCWECWYMDFTKAVLVTVF